jgi:Double zinc ribbon
LTGRRAVVRKPTVNVGSNRREALNDSEQEFPVDDGLVQNLHALLANALRRTRPDPFGTPVTVAEIYQDLVPYRSVRVPLGFQMNADYEHTLLRLLAGESSLARLEPETARGELRTELEAPNPNVGLFRKFAACDVWVEPSDIQVREPEAAPLSPPAPAQSRAEPVTVAPDLPGLDEVAPAADPVARDDLPGRVEQVEASWDVSGDDNWDETVAELLLEEEVEVEEVELEVVEPISDTAKEAAPPAAGEPNDQRAAVMFESHASHPATVAEPKTSGACAFCRSSLPGGRVVRFCPHCGADQSLKPCVSCNEPLDPTWVFCIGCGTKQT